MSSANNNENPFKSPVLEDEEPSVPLSGRVQKELGESRNILSTFYKSLDLYLGNIAQMFFSFFGNKDDINNQFFSGQGLKVDISKEERETLRKKDHDDADIESVDWEHIKEQLLADGKLKMNKPLPNEAFNDEDSINHDPDGDEDQPYEEDDEWKH